MQIGKELLWLSSNGRFADAIRVVEMPEWLFPQDCKGKKGARFMKTWNLTPATRALLACTPPPNPPTAEEILEGQP